MFYYTRTLFNNKFYYKRTFTSNMFLNNRTIINICSIKRVRDWKGGRGQLVRPRNSRGSRQTGLPAVSTSKQGVPWPTRPAKASFDIVAFGEIVLPTQYLDIRRIF